MKRHIIFDFDDTLSPSYELNQQLFVDTFTPFFPQIDQDYLRKFHYERRGTGMLEQFQDIVDKFSLDKSAKDLMQYNQKIHKTSAPKMNIFEGVENMLKHFKNRGKILSICSNRDTKSLNIVLKKHKIDSYFQNTISCHSAGYDKPDPYCLNELLQKYPDISSGETIYFGDSKTDADFASNANIEYVIVDHYLNKKMFYHLILESFGDSEDSQILKRSLL